MSSSQELEPDLLHFLGDFKISINKCFEENNNRVNLRMFRCLSLMDAVKIIYYFHSFQSVYMARLLLHGNITKLASLYSCIFTLSSFPQML